MSTINTLYGPVVGFDDISPIPHSSTHPHPDPESETPVSKWLGIPYAHAGRWQRPGPPKSWTTTLECTKFGPRFPQGLIITDIIFGRNKEFTQTHPASSQESEELGFNLNVYAPPPGLTTEKLPVLVWIYGGSLEGGSADSAIYDPTGWLRREAQEGRYFIVVTGNYRCNIFGFMACQDLVNEDSEELAGNYGVYDCIAMLQWVQDNISNFGGDPDNVTVFGESAGAFLVGALLVTQQKLFNRAILQSGSLECMTHRSVDCQNNQEYFASLLEYFNVPEDLTSEQRIKLLREIPASKLVEFISARGSVINDYGLTIEETTTKSSIWPKPAVDLIKERRWNPYLKSLLIGHTKDEGSIFAFLLQTVTPEGYENLLKKRCPFTPRDKIDQLYPSPQDIHQEEKTPLTIDWTTCVGSRMIHDHLMEVPLENLALAFDGAKHELTGEPCKVFFYELNETLPSIDQGLNWGAFHTVDIPLIFNLKTLWEPESDQAKTSAKLGELWVNFAHTGSPDPDWSEYSPSRSPIKFFIGKGGQVFSKDMALTRTDLEKQRIHFWIDQLPTIVSLKEHVAD